MKHWTKVTKFDTRACALADRHYSRRKVGSPQFMPPGQTIVLLSADERAVWGWWRPHPDSGIKAMNGLDVGPDGLLTYVWDKKIRSANPGYCFKVAGWRAIGRSADKRKTLLQKCAGAAR
jgi:hypothetical protein